MPITHIHSVSGGRRPSGPDPLVGSAIDLPHVGLDTDVYHLNIEGWALGRAQPMVTVEVYADYADPVRIASVPIEWPRPDIVQAFPEQLWADRAGFRASVNLLGLVGDFELAIDALSADGTRTPLGAIKGHRAPLPKEASDAFDLLLVTTHGRSGSSWLLHILGQHPDIFAYRPFEHETKVAAYWLGVLETLTSPRSYLQQLSTIRSGPEWWVGSDSLPDWGLSEPYITDWLGQAPVVDLVNFCRHRVRQLYGHLYQGRVPTPRFVLEKVVPNRVGLVAKDVFSGTKELILVRDFRDMLCSMVAYTAGGRSRNFGPERGATVDEYVYAVRDFGESLMRIWHARKDDALLVHYEELVRRPEECISSILGYLSIDGDPRLVRSMVVAASADTPHGSRHRTVRNAAESVGRWRRDLSPALKVTCERVLRDVLEEFGYCD